MFAAAHDQENLVHAHQAAAAAKPLNQGTRGLKTPSNKGPKTPFRVPLNDENAPLKTGKSIFKPNGKNLEGAAKDGKQAKDGGNDGFVTPAGMRNRAPLGMKTTNAKAKAFQTPAPLSIEHGKEKSSVPKSLSPRMRRAKVKVHQEEPVKLEAQDEEPEIEYMPPQPKPLPDDPDDFPSDKQYPMFSAENITRGWFSVFSDADDEDFIAMREKEEAEAQARHDKVMDDLLHRAIDNDPVLNSIPLPGSSTNAPASHETGREEAEEKQKRTETGKGPTKTPSLRAQGPSTSVSRSAASALSRPAIPSSLTRPTTSTAQKTKPFAPSDRKALLPGTRTTGNVAASRTTLGYAQGRAASAALRRPLQDSTRNARPCLSGRNNSAGEAKKAVREATNRPAMNGNGRQAANQKENWKPAAQTAALLAPTSAEAELETWVRDREAGFDFGRGSEDVNESLVGDLTTVDEMFREEAMREFQLELPEGF